MAGARFLFLDIRVDQAGRYRPGGTSRQIIHLEDNDNYWTGTMRDIYFANGTTNVGYTELAFRMRMLRAAHTVQAWLVNDGQIDSTVKGSGPIPVGEWPLAVTLTTNSFVAESVAIPMPPLPLFGGAVVTRTLRFNARPCLRRRE